MLADDFAVNVAYTREHIEFKWNGGKRRLVMTAAEAKSLMRWLKDALEKLDD
jgi:hypothetical protein